MNPLANKNGNAKSGKGSAPRPFFTQGATTGAWVFTGKLKPRLLSGGTTMAIKPVYRWRPKCPCYRCASIMDILSTKVICPVCANPRCPRGTDHDHDCTASNEPGQPGSRY